MITIQDHKININRDFPLIIKNPKTNKIHHFSNSRIKNLKPKRFNFKEDDKTIDGFLAHEVSSVVPEAVTGEKDATEMQQLDYSKLVTLTIAALQEEIAKREALEARVAALES